MTINELLNTYDLERSLLVGYYGGGNYGDELLLEVLANLLKIRGVRRATIAYQNPASYQTFHHDFGYERVTMNHKRQFLRAIWSNKNVVVGGGGLWGLDVNSNIFLLSLLLFISRFCLKKRIFLLGVGYYNSTSRLGRASAWLAGKAATHIVARDQETFDNFKKLTSHVSLDDDIAWHIRDLPLDSYQKDFAALEQRLHITQKTLLITLRRFKANQRNSYLHSVSEFLAANPDQPVIVMLMEPQAVDPADYAQAVRWQKQYRQLQFTDFSYNPLALFLLFQKYHDRLALIGPQFHVILTAHLADVPLLPLAYDNKVSQLLKRIGTRRVVPISHISKGVLQQFANDFFGKEQ